MKIASKKVVNSKSIEMIDAIKALSLKAISFPHIDFGRCEIEKLNYIICNS